MSCKLDDTFLKNGPGRFGTAEIMTSISIPLTSKVNYNFYWYDKMSMTTTQRHKCTKITFLAYAITWR